MNSVERLETSWRDTVYALRTIRTKPVFAATAVLTLALAIGGNTAMFTVIRAVLLNPLQYRDPDCFAYRPVSFEFSGWIRCGAAASVRRRIRGAAHRLR